MIFVAVSMKLRWRTDTNGKLREARLHSITLMSLFLGQELNVERSADVQLFGDLATDLFDAASGFEVIFRPNTSVASPECTLANSTCSEIA